MCTEMAYTLFMAGSPPLTPRRQATRDRLLHAALDVFAAKGVGSASVEDICEQAGFTRGAFYSNFSDKSELISGLIEQQSKEQTALVGTLLQARKGGLQETLDAVVAFWADQQLVDPRWHLVQMELTLLAARDPAVANLWVAHQQELRHELARLLRQAAARESVRFTIDPDLLVDLAIGVVQRATTNQLLEPARPPSSDLTSTFTPLVLRSFTQPDPTTNATIEPEC